jgi:hypothetical protein
MANLPALPPDAPSDIVDVFDRWLAVPMPWRTGGGRWSTPEHAARWQHADAVAAMLNSAGRTAAERDTAHAMARRYILKHMDRTPTTGRHVGAHFCAYYACGRLLPDAADTGRPRKYCDGACKVAAHRARRRA